MKNPFTKSRLSTLGLALGGTAIQFAEKLQPVTAACPWIGPLSILAGALAGFGFNRLAAAADKRKELQDATRELLTNRDIAFAQARAVAARLRRYAGQLGGGGKSDAAKRLIAIAATSETWWMTIVSDPARAEFAKLRDDEIIGQLTPYLAGEDRLILDKDEWTELLLAADAMTAGKPEERLTGDLARYFAGYLAGSFTHDFVEALKTDFATEGKAYAAVSLRFFGEILISVRENAKAIGELKPFLEQLPTLMRRAQEGASLIRVGGGIPEELYNALCATGDRLEDAILKLTRKMHGRFDTVPSEVADELERRKLLKPTFEFHADISRIVKYAPAELIGRDDEKNLLSEAWDKAVREETNRPHVVTFVALGGEGKTSLVAKWVVDEMLAKGWPGCDAVFAWPFYSQGTREQTAVSSDLFLSEALTFFGDEAMAKSAAGAFDKGRRLARLVGERRALLILDGLEPLQYAPTSPTPGELKDQGLAALLKGLAATSHGLCVVTTRHALPDLRAFHGQTVREEKLTRLARAAGVRLLKAHGVTGSDRPHLPHTDDAGKKELLSEFEALVEDVDGHALTLHLLGSYLRDAHSGDIRKVGLVKLEEANAEEQGGHAFHVMDAYVAWLESSPGLQPVAPSGGLKPPTTFSPGQRALALLRLMGLFDRPASADCLDALWKGDAIAGLTEPLIGLTDAQRNIALKRLEEARLLTVNRDAAGTLLSLDAHPLLREYFAARMKDEGGRMKSGSAPSSFILHPSSFILSARPPAALRTPLRDDEGPARRHPRRPPTALPSRGPRLPGGLAAGGL